MTDKDLKQHVQNALDWEPSVDAKDIGVSVDQGVVTLRGNVASYAEKIAAEKIPQPTGRHWKLAVCGPHRSPQVELGPEFETSWDPQGADFALMLGAFYCRQLDAPVIAEIRRDGVLYARVYDPRGRSYRTLLNPYPGSSE